METRIATALAHGTPAEAAPLLAQELSKQLAGATPVLVMVFASTVQPLSQLMPLLAARFPESVLLSASTAGEFTEKGDAKGSVAAFALAGDYQVYAGVGTNLKQDLEGAVNGAIK